MSSGADRAHLLPVELWRFDEVQHRGVGANPLGGPVAAVAWMTKLPQAPVLRSGDVVTTGSLTAAPPLAVGERRSLVGAGDLGLAPVYADT